MKIIEETNYMINVPTNPEELAVLLDNFAGDWQAVLEFINNIAIRQSIVFNSKEVSEIMRKKYE